MIKQAIILAAGEGERLRPFTLLKPKVMIPIANKPILQYVVEALTQSGIRRIVIVVGYHKEQVQDFFGSGEQFRAEIKYVVQNQQLGTAHALKQARAVAEERFLVLPGDNIIDSTTIAELSSIGTDTILVKEQSDGFKYGVVALKNGVVDKLVEKPGDGQGILVNTGIYALGTSIFSFIEREVDLPTALNNFVAANHSVAVKTTKGAWLDVLYPWDILKLNESALSETNAKVSGALERNVVITGKVAIGPDCVIRSHSYIMGPAVIGQNCEIGPGACILPSTSIGDNVVISPFTLIRNSVIGNNVIIGPHSSLQDSVVDRGSQLGGCFMAHSGQSDVKIDQEYHQVRLGVMVGEHCETGDNVVAMPGVMLGNHSRIKALKVLEHNVPDGSLVV